MFDPYAGWSRLLAASSAMAQTGLDAAETMNASGEVIAARSAIIGAAMASPLHGDHVELNRMIPEKIDAFSRSALATTNVWWAMQAAWLAQIQHFGAMAAKGRMLTSAEIGDLGDRSAALAVGTVEAAARAGSAALKPVHREATANARRLKRKRAG